MPADRARHLFFFIWLALIVSPLAAQVLEINEDGTVKQAPVITGKEWSRTAQVPPIALPANKQTAESAAEDAALSAHLPQAASKWAVQLGAYDSLAQLDADWRRIRNRSAGVLDRYTIMRAEASVAGRRYHRLTVNGFSNLSAALDLCKILRRNGQNCYVRDGSMEQAFSRN